MNINGNNLRLTNKEVEILRALIDKATPKQAKLVNFHLKAIVCPTCNSRIEEEDKYCSTCGQKINEEVIAL